MTNIPNSSQKEGMFLIQKPNGQTEVVVRTKEQAIKYCKGKEGYTWDKWSYWDR